MLLRTANPVRTLGAALLAALVGLPLATLLPAAPADAALAHAG